MKKEETWGKLVDLKAVLGQMPKGTWDIKKANLGGVNLSHADLFSVKLTEGNLSHADLSGAELSMADLSRADLSEADLRDANFYGARLYKANLSGANLSGARFNMADLSRADFSRADLSHAILHEANIHEAYFSEANLSGANLSHAILSNANFSEADLSGADFSGADFIGAILNEADLSHANFSEANLTKAILKGAKIISANFNLATLSCADITGATFWGVSTAGWKIDGIKAKRIFFCPEHEKDKDQYKKDFQKGQFEELYKATPLVELIFAEGLNPASLFVITALIEKIRRQFPDHDVRMADIFKTPSETRIGIKTNKDNFLLELGQLLYDALYQDIAVNPLAASLVKTLPPNTAKTSEEVKSAPSLVSFLNCRRVTVNYFYSDGSRHGTIS